MTWVTITNAVATTATKFGGLDHGNKIANMFNGIDISDTVTIHSNVTWTFQGSTLQVSDSDDSHSYDITGGALSANVTVNLPALTTNDTLPMIGIPQTWAEVQTFSKERIDTEISTPADPSTGFTKIYPKQIDANNSAYYVKHNSGGSMKEVRIS